MRSADFEPFGKFKRADTLRVELANLYDSRLSQLRASALLAFGALMATLPILFHHVGHVFGLCAQKQMGRIHAAWIVTAMTNMHSFGNGAVVQFIAKSMSGNLFVANSKLPVAVHVPAGYPLPAFVRAAPDNFGPEALFNRRGRRLGMMPRKKFEGLSLDVTELGICSPGYVRWLTAATFTELWGVVCGIMGLHKNLPFLCQAGSDSQSLPGVFVALLPVHYSTIGDMTP